MAFVVREACSKTLDELFHSSSYGTREEFILFQVEYGACAAQM